MMSRIYSRLTIHNGQWYTVTNTGCWEWNGRHSPSGYGWFYLDGKKQYSHRIVYEIFNGSIPQGLDVLHSCDNPPCCNPEHLGLGTARDNARDMSMKLRGPNKLNWQDIDNIKQLRQRGVSLRKIAEQFGVVHKTINRVLHRETYTTNPAQRVPKFHLEKPSTPCVEWTKSPNSGTYGRKRVNGKMTLVHRHAWEQANGPIPTGLMVLHKCDNPRCIRIDHLALGTAQDNSDDMNVKLRGMHKLNMNQAREIRHLREEENKPYTELGAIFDVHPTTAMKICRNELYAS